MTQPVIKFIKIIFFCFLIFLILGFLIKNILVENTTKSEKLGYYLRFPILNISKGNLYSICLNSNNLKYINVLKNLNITPSNECDYNMPTLLKSVVAISGDTVEIRKDGVYINNIYIINSKSFIKGRGVPLYPISIGYKQVMKNDEFFVIGDSKTSIDSRYFGVIHKSQFKQRLIFIFNKEHKN